MTIKPIRNDDDLQRAFKRLHDGLRIPCESLLAGVR